MPGFRPAISHFVDDNVAFAVQINIHCTTAPVKDFVDLLVAVYVLMLQFIPVLHLSIPPLFLF